MLFTQKKFDFSTCSYNNLCSLKYSAVLREDTPKNSFSNVTTTKVNIHPPPDLRGYFFSFFSKSVYLSGYGGITPRPLLRGSTTLKTLFCLCHP